MRFLSGLYLTIIIALFSACTSTEECREETDVNVQIGFYTNTTNTTTQQILQSSLSIDSIWVHGLSKDSFIYENIKSEELILIPLNSMADHTDYVIQFNDKTDTITFFHQNNDKYYLSLECGCLVAHTIDEVVSTQHYIDSVSIVYPEVNNTSIENVQIFHF